MMNLTVKQYGRPKSNKRKLKAGIKEAAEDYKEDTSFSEYFVGSNLRGFK